MHGEGGAEFSSFWKRRSLFWGLTPRAKGLAMHPISPGCKANICCLFWQCRPRLLEQSEWGGQEVCASWPKASGLWELSGVLSCLFWESFCLVGWYLETAKNFALHFHSNRKEKGGGTENPEPPSKYWQVKQGQPDFTFSPPPLQSLRKQKEKMPWGKVPLPHEDSRQGDSLRISWYKKPLSVTVKGYSWGRQPGHSLAGISIRVALPSFLCGLEKTL